MHYKHVCQQNHKVDFKQINECITRLLNNLLDMIQVKCTEAGMQTHLVTLNLIENGQLSSLYSEIYF